MSEDFTTMTDEQLAQSVADGTAEMERRSLVRDAERRADDQTLAALRAAGAVNGGPFVAPVGVLGAYPRGWRVTSDGRAFEALVPGATTAPPSEEWTEVDIDSDLIEFWEDREYQAGDLARDAGIVWEALSTVNGPRPSEFPGGWSPVT